MGSNSCWSFERRNQTRGCCIPLAPFNSFYVKNGLPAVSFKKFRTAIEDWRPITESYFLCHLTAEIVSFCWTFKLSSKLHNSRARMEFPGTGSATMQIANTRMNQATLQVGHEWKSVRFCNQIDLHWHLLHAFQAMAPLKRGRSLPNS